MEDEDGEFVLESIDQDPPRRSLIEQDPVNGASAQPRSSDSVLAAPPRDTSTAVCPSPPAPVVLLKCPIAVTTVVGSSKLKSEIHVPSKPAHERPTSYKDALLRFPDHGLEPCLAPKWP
jgi:hypothetical protein